MLVPRHVHERVEGGHGVKALGGHIELHEVRLDECRVRDPGAGKPQLLFRDVHADHLEPTGKPGSLRAVPAAEVEDTGAAGEPACEFLEEALPGISFDPLAPLAEVRGELVVARLHGLQVVGATHASGTGPIIVNPTVR